MFAYLAFPDFEKELAHELSEKKAISDRLFLSEVERTPVWAQLCAKNAETLEIQSIGDAVKALKARGKWWACYSSQHHRRAELIQEQLPKYKIPPLSFLGSLPQQPMGFWTLLDKNTLLAAANTSSPFPLGEVIFQEDKKTPPSRAYLKLWELFTVHGLRPKAGELCMDLGSSPGGWTWVLQQMGCRVLSVDKAPLAPQIASLPGIQALKKDAFQLKPSEVGAVDWLFSDIICYPPRLFELVQAWRASGLCKNFVCTIKFQAETDWETMNKFREIPGSRLLHLCHNKHEVTWALLFS